MLGMASGDIFQSIYLGLSSLPAPRDSGVLYAIGNQTTCNIQGFIGMFGTTSTCYYCCGLSGYFLLAIKFGVAEEKLTKYYEPLVHGIAILVPLVSVIFVQIHSGFYTSGNQCWIAAKPLMCTQLENVECVSGSDFNVLRWAIVGGPIIGCFCIVTTNMLIIFWTLLFQNASPHISIGSPLNQETGNNNDERRPSVVELYQESKRKKKSSRAERDRKQGMVQAILYILAFIICYFFAFLYQAMTGLNKSIPFVYFILSKVFTPLQGFFNFFIFVRPRIVNEWHRNPNYTFFEAVKYGIQSRGEDPRRSHRRRCSVPKSQRLLSRNAVHKKAPNKSSNNANLEKKEEQDIEAPLRVSFESFHSGLSTEELK